jgi:endonuclease I
MKKIYSISLLFFSFINIAQPPAGYYSTATGTGYSLKTQLKTIITNGHVDKGYGAGTNQTNNGLWSAYGLTDRDNGIGYENDNTIVDIYSENPTGSDPYNFNFNTTSGANAGQCGNYSVEGDCYNREHLIPQSYFGHNNSGPKLNKYFIMRHDIQHVYPTDGEVNNKRNDYAFGKVNVASFTSLNGSKLGSALNSGYSAGFTGTVFEPIDEFKGDIARVFFYFATRYEDDMDELYSSYTTVDCRVMFNGSIDQVFSPTFLNILLTWHNQDPVSTKEILRNNACYNHQCNRNPFIDNPSYVTAIWGAPLSSESFETATISVYPNPANDNKINIQTEVDLDEIQLISINGQIMQQIKKPAANGTNYTLENLPKGFYILKLSSENQSTIKKIIVN